jgi:hypothetical protein
MRRVPRYAAAHPECVERLVLVDAQGFIEGLGPMVGLYKCVLFYYKLNAVDIARKRPVSQPFA